jgi:PAS domain S-box-containing protein
MKTGKSISGYALKIAFPYLLLGGAWILWSDRFLLGMVNENNDTSALTVLQTFKGWFFVIMSAVLVYYTSRRYLTQLAQVKGQLKEKDQALTDSESALLSLLEGLPGMAYRSSGDGCRSMEYVSDGCSGLTGYAPADFLKHRSVTYGNLILEDDREMVARQIQRALRHRKSFQIEYRILAKNGKVKWVWEHGCGVHGEPRGQQTIVGYIFDSSVTRKTGKHHQAEEHLERIAGGELEPETSRMIFGPRM